MNFWLKVLLFWPYVTYAKEHQRCLRHIDELERDLFPEWFPKPGWGKPEIISMAPGAIIPINQGGHVEYLSPPSQNYQQIFRNFYPCASSGRSHSKLTWQEQVMEEIASL